MMITDEQIEALWKTWDGDKNWLRTFGYQQFARAILELAGAPVVEAEIPAGWKLVPIEPTAEMFEAANKIDNAMFAGGSSHGADHEQVWNAMVEAAPAPGEAK